MCERSLCRATVRMAIRVIETEPIQPMDPVQVSVLSEAISIPGRYPLSRD